MAGKDSTKPQDSATKPADMKLWVQQRAPDGSPRVQYYRPRKTGWTTRKMARFLTALRATSNVTEAARAVKMDVSGAYGLRKKDATFAAGWAEALEQGYAELEMLLLRQSIHGSETTEMVDDGNEEGRKRTKTVHSYPHSMALRLLMAHKGTVEAFRAEQGIERPGSEELRAEIHAKIAAMRSQSGTDDPMDGDTDA
ncbi:MAG: hypothetical protein KA533_00765 [Sphingobium sp.]|nr:hypothetical protein [Sphingobium sp.]MBP8671182.1 hypothetical protein [Sphingobium sp.]MBP9156769.1 hypothetical protein [Sphingobium sp.]